MASTRLLFCSNYRPEIERLSGDGALNGVEVRYFRGMCGRPPLSWGKLLEQAGQAGSSSELWIMGGCCLPSRQEPPQEFAGVKVKAASNCFELVAPEAALKRVRPGDYVLTPGWLSNWRETMELWGFDRKTAREFFAESADSLLLLDTGVHERSAEELLELAEFLDLPHRALYVGLDRLRESVASLAPAKEEPHRSVDPHRAAADYAMALDLMGRIASMPTLTDTIDEIHAVLDLITDAADMRIAYRDHLGVERQHSWGTPSGGRFFGMAGAKEAPPVAPLPSGRGFILQLKHREEHVGSIYLDSIPNASALDHYMNFALAFSGVCALAIKSKVDQDAYEHEQREYEERLRQASKMEAIGTLAGGIAHDFNNLLASILGYTEMTVPTLPKGSEAHENLLEVLSASRRAKELVRQLLTFGRRTEKKLAAVEPATIVEETMKLLSTVIPRTVNVVSEISARGCLVKADPTELHQVVMNLCTNGFQAMPGQSGVLRVALEEVTMTAADSSRDGSAVPARFVRLTVEDDGAGMDEATRSRIFEPYFTTKPLGKGTGLGLALVHGIVTGCGGSISVRSAPGRGTRFTVLLPVDAEPIPLPVAAADVSAKGGRATILLVDDEPSLARMGSKMLESMGYRVMPMTDPLAAVALFEGDPSGFDLILTDQTMPVLTGSELIERVRAIRPEVPAVICTGYSDLIDEEGARRKGISGYVHKPYDREGLTSAVARALAEREAEQELIA